MVNMTVDLVVQTDAKGGGRRLDLPYFIAISGPDGAVIDRQDFVGRVDRGQRPPRRVKEA